MGDCDLYNIQMDLDNVAVQIALGMIFNGGEYKK